MGMLPNKKVMWATNYPGCGGEKEDNGGVN